MTFPSEKADNSTVLDVALVLVLPARQAAAQVTPSTTLNRPLSQPLPSQGPPVPAP